MSISEACKTISTSEANNLDRLPKLLRSFGSQKIPEWHSERLIDLISFGKNVNAQDSHGCTALHLALDSHYHCVKEVIETLLHAGAHVNVINNEGQTPLHYCAMASAGYSLDLKPSLILLLHYGALYVNAQDSQGCTALHYAVNPPGIYLSCPAGEFVEILLNSGADVNVVNNEGQTALHYCVEAWHRYHHREYRKIIESNLTALLNHGTYINAQDNDGCTALHYTMKINRFHVSGIGKVLRVLVDNGADVSIRNNRGQTLLHYCIQAWDQQAHQENDRQFLILVFQTDNGASVNTRDNEGLTPLHYAVKNISSLFEGWNDECVKILVTFGADASIGDNEGQTPLHYFAKSCVPNYQFQSPKEVKFVMKIHQEFISILIRDGAADVNAADKFGRTPLWYATFNDNRVISEVLLKFGADVNLEDKDGITPKSNMKSLGDGSVWYSFTKTVKMAFGFNTTLDLDKENKKYDSHRSASGQNYMTEENSFEILCKDTTDTTVDELKLNNEITTQPAIKTTDVTTPTVLNQDTTGTEQKSVTLTETARNIPSNPKPDHFTERSLESDVTFVSETANASFSDTSSGDLNSSRKIPDKIIPPTPSRELSTTEPSRSREAVCPSHFKELSTPMVEMVQDHLDKLSSGDKTECSCEITNAYKKGKLKVGFKFYYTRKKYNKYITHHHHQKNVSTKIVKIRGEGGLVPVCSQIKYVDRRRQEDDDSESNDDDEYEENEDDKEEDKGNSSSSSSDWDEPELGPEDRDVEIERDLD